MPHWIPDLSAHHGPVYLGIAEALAIAVRTGRLRPGEVLPPQRLLAGLLGVNLSTVTRAYREAERRGLIEGNTRRGTVVRARAEVVDLFGLHPAPGGNAPCIDLSTNTPAEDARDDSIAQVIAALQEERALTRLMGYQGVSDWEPWREQAAKWLAAGGLELPADRIILCAGAQHALGVALAVASDRPDIAVERFTYPGMKAIARERAYRLHPLEMDEEGVTPAALLKASRRGIRVAVLSSALQNPTGASMSMARRKQVAAVAQARNMLLIEEDVYGALLPGRLPPLAALAPDHVYYVSGLSKTVAPGLRFGMLGVPPKQLQRFTEAIHTTSWYLSPLGAEVASRLIASGAAARRLAWQRKEIVKRNAVLDEALGGGPVQVVRHAPHRWLPLAPRTRPEQLVAQLEERGLRVVAGSSFGVGPAAATTAFLRLSLGAAAGRKAVQRAGLLLRACEGLGL
ncbi:MAG TPA: PLP-dependent aminotransferase family protein [Noviherbaspirillum sp.]|jgi:DNA-binding transcriptional MocR family regulator|uniref:aminotransferase-like domain-containing protein n=1 Tax=Noviherbaspirillum sp. TaxID=1926288 RepID=UPI002F93395A